jgi:hypothetical protein
MSRRSPKRTGYRKPKPTKETEHTPAKPSGFFERFGLAIGLLSLVITALGLVAFRARPTVSLEAPLDPDNVLTTPVTISNEGVLYLADVRVVCFTRVIEDSRSNFAVNNIGKDYVPPAGTLEDGEKETVPLLALVASTSPITSADVALIVSFEPGYMPFWTKRRAFRFKSVRQKDGLLRFEEQPAADTLELYDKAVRQLAAIYK